MTFPVHDPQIERRYRVIVNGGCPQNYITYEEAMEDAREIFLAGARDVVVKKRLRSGRWTTVAGMHGAVA